jgi:hypothetical protein
MNCSPTRTCDFCGDFSTSRLPGTGVVGTTTGVVGLDATGVVGVLSTGVVGTAVVGVLPTGVVGTAVVGVLPTGVVGTAVVGVLPTGVVGTAVVGVLPTGVVGTGVVASGSGVRVWVARWAGAAAGCDGATDVSAISVPCGVLSWAVPGDGMIQFIASA